MELTVQNVYGLLIRSQLLSLEEAKAMFARWQAEASEHASNAARFAAWMVAHKYVTEYQASLLARGHAEGFFLNDYKILERIGKGRMAGVYKARHRLGPIVALKVLPPSKAREPALLMRFQREARLAVRLKHPNIVRTFQVDRAGTLHYLVMEFLEGETVEDLIARRRSLPPAEAARIVYQALQGLQHIHDRGLVHRDLKPANLMLVPPSDESTLGCTVKIVDIGLGKLFEDGGNAPDPELTGEGVLLGTPDYMAPEQARDARSIDIRADIYSLGCVLYHLIAGQPPFPETNIISQMIRHATEMARPLKEFNKDVPDGLQQIVNWMMAKDPSARYPTPARAAAALEVFLAADSGPLSSPDLDPAMRPYLTWLEKENNQAPSVPVAAPVASPGPAAVPVAVPVATGKAPVGPVPVAAPVKPARSDRAAAKAARAAKAGRSRDESKRKAKKKKAPPPVPSVSDPAEVNVELVPYPRSAGLTRRDFAMFGAGVGCVLIAYAVGRGLAALLARPRERKPDDE